MDQEQAASDVTVAFGPGSVALQHMLRDQERTSMGAIRFFPVDPSASASFTHAEAGCVFSLVCNYEENVLPIRMTEVGSRTFSPIELILAGDFRELS